MPGTIDTKQPATKRRKLNNGSAQNSSSTPATPTLDDKAWKNLCQKAQNSIVQISNDRLPSWSIEEFKHIVKPFVEQNPEDFDSELAILRFSLLESMAIPSSKDDQEQQFIDDMMDKYSDWTKNHLPVNQTEEFEVTFKSFLKYASPLIKCEDHTNFESDDVSRFIKFFGGRTSVDCVGNLDSAAIIDDFLNGEWEKYLQLHPSVRALVKPFYVFAECNPVSESDGESGEEEKEDVEASSEKRDQDFAAQKLQIFDEWSNALDAYPPSDVPNLKFPKRIEDNNFVWSFPGNVEGRRRAFHFVSFMRQQVKGTRFWCSHSSVLIRV